MTEDKTVAEVAAGLTKAQRRALISAGACKGGKYWTPYAVHDTSLARAGLLTDLGLAVRAHLQSLDGSKESGSGIR